MINYRIKDLNQDEKPREKAINIGIENLTNVELLAIILRSGGKGTSVLDLAREMNTKFNGITGLAAADLSQLIHIKYINTTKAITIKAAIEIGFRISKIQKKNTTEIKSPEDVFNIIRKDVFQKEKELLYLISLNTRNKLIAKDLISLGSINETLLSTREIFKQAFLRNAVAIILVHNHPSNDPTPSSEDIKATEIVAQTGKKVGIPLIDHIIVTNDSFISLKALNYFTTYKKGGEENEIKA